MGSNVGDRIEHLRAGVAGLSAAMPKVVVVGKSSVYDSTPVGVTDQPDFYNAVVAVETTLDPYELLTLCHGIEMENGRQRIARWGPRTLDVDILMFAAVEQDDPKLILPHPRLVERRFALEPLLEIEPEATLPDGTSLSAVLEKLGDEQAAWPVGTL
jgi:2-amino-4-hydroxy-6-hydroxymethyldihydropteridine diphosphokinase